MSGGVDSSTAVWLLQQAGYDPVGFTMSLFSPDALPPDQRSQCHTARDVADAQAVAQRLGISHHTLDLSESFRREVMDPFVQAYEQGQTPNPCVLCNRAIKFVPCSRRPRRWGVLCWPPATTPRWNRIPAPDAGC